MGGLYLAWIVLVVAGGLWGMLSGSGQTGLDPIGWVLLMLAGVVYPLPAVLAASRRHPSRQAITALTLLLGWTGVGWLVALAWSLTRARDGTIEDRIAHRDATTYRP